MADARPYVYFQPDCFVMRLTHTANEIAPPALADLWHWLLDEANHLFPSNNVRIPAAGDNMVRQTKFPPPKDSTGPLTTYVFCQTEGLREPDLAEFVHVIGQMNPKWNFDTGGAGSVQLEALDLNWLACVGDWAGDGGPGGLPEPFPPIGTPLLGPPPYRYHGDPVTFLNQRNKQGEGITVVILDTAPKAEALNAAFHKWVSEKPAGQKHPLLESLWGPDAAHQRLKIVPMSPQTQTRLQNYKLEFHRYPITDHGLFAAGIINSIVPQANLYLYEALNEHGVCDGESVLGGLRWVAENLPDAKVVINCSLFLLIPYNLHHFNSDLSGYLPGKGPWDNAGELSAWLKEQGRFSEPAFQLFNTADRAVVAAAGNDWHGDGTERPRPRFPAAFNSVLGVGALDDVEHFKSASYSNLDDDPLNVGISAFGGGAERGTGVIGVFISDGFPPDPAHPNLPLTNQTGWARWSGTSFATPLISGFVAALMDDPVLPDTPGAATDWLRVFFTQKNVNTNENAFAVTQESNALPVTPP